MRRLQVALASCMAGLAAMAAFAGGAGASYPGTNNGWLAFASVVDGNVDIYTTLPNGQGRHRLTTSSAFQACPSWSADGKELAYCSDESGAFEIWTMKQDGTQKEQVTRLESYATFPDISPDGRRIAFTNAGTNGLEAIWVLDRATGIATELVGDGDLPGNNALPVWSPDGTTLAFVNVQLDADGFPVAADLYLVDADGSDLVNLTDDPSVIEDQLPDWHPSGDSLVYATFDGQGGDLWTIDADGSNKHAFVATAADEFGPTWSPDGREVAFLRQAAGEPRLVNIVEADGTGLRAVASDLGVRQLVPAWQPRGRR